jgi:hypothetical protein
MFQFFARALAALCQDEQRRPTARPSTRLGLEEMEPRLAPTALPLVAPILVATAQVSSTGGTEIALPERCVHGYKWRPFPREAGQPQVGAVVVGVKTQEAITSAINAINGGQQGGNPVTVTWRL